MGRSGCVVISYHRVVFSDVVLWEYSDEVVWVCGNGLCQSGCIVMIR